MLGCRRQNFIKGGKALGSFGDLTALCEFKSVFKSSLLLFFRTPSSELLEMPFLEEEDELNANFASSQRNCKNA